jgi:tRNA(Arg) A34 adenosine deaminase TadA
MSRASRFPALSVAEIRLPDWIDVDALPDAVPDDAACMRIVLELARQNVMRAHGGPFGALVREEPSGRLLSVGVNLVRPAANPALHAEVVALSLAGRETYPPDGATLFTSCEPCIMCLGAVHWSGVRRVVYSALREDAEAIGFSEGAGCVELKHQMRARGVAFEAGLLRPEGVEILTLYRDAGGAIYGPEKG